MSQPNPQNPISIDPSPLIDNRPPDPMHNAIMRISDDQRYLTLTIDLHGPKYKSQTGRSVKVASSIGAKLVRDILPGWRSRGSSQLRFSFDLYLALPKKTARMREEKAITLAEIEHLTGDPRYTKRNP